MQIISVNSGEFRTIQFHGQSVQTGIFKRPLPGPVKIGRLGIAGDAIADPLTGLHAALAAWHSYKSGGGRLIALALRDVVAHCIQFSAPHTPAILQERCNEWQRVVERAGLGAVQPVARRSQGISRPLGADTQAVLSELGISC